jgi:hypothetical protein
LFETLGFLSGKFSNPKISRRPIVFDFSLKDSSLMSAG